MSMTNRRLPERSCRNNQKEARDAKEKPSREKPEKRSEVIRAWGQAGAEIIRALGGAGAETIRASSEAGAEVIRASGQAGAEIILTLILGVALCIIAWRDPTAFFQYLRDTRSSSTVARMDKFDEASFRRRHECINGEAKNGVKSGNKIEHNEHTSSSGKQRPGPGSGSAN